MNKISVSIKAKIIYLVLLSLTLLGIILVIISIYNNENMGKSLTGEKITAILNTTKLNIDGDKFENIAKSKDDTIEYYEYLRKMLKQIKDINGLKYLYTMVKVDNENFMYIIDGNEKDDESFSKLGDEGKIADNGGEKLLITFNEGKNSYTDIVLQGKWGWLLSGFSAIKNSKGEVVGVIGGDLSANTIKTQMAVFRNTLVVFAFIITLFISIFTILLANNVSNSIKNFFIKFIKGAEGDLTVRMTQNSKDEIGELSSKFNIFMGNISEIIGNIRLSSNNIASGAEQLSATMEQINKSVESLGNSSSSTTASVEEMLNSTSSVAENVTNLLKNSEETAILANNGGRAVKDSINEMNKIKKVVNNGSENVKILGIKANEIGDIVTVINNIASQTNLLALNAAIEAARAGDAGKGFEVVADEVRKLAEKTTESTKEISKMIKEIQTETSNVILKMKEVDTEVEVGVKIADNTGILLEKIVSRIDMLKEMITLIANSTHEQTIAAEDISKQTEFVTSNIEENGRAIEQSTEAIIELSNIAEELINMVNRFTTEDDIQSMVER